MLDLEKALAVGRGFFDLSHSVGTGMDISILIGVWS